MKLILADTVELMKSEDYSDRFVAEYIQTKIRYEQLKDFNTKIEASVRTRGLDNGVEEPLHDCPAGLLREQQAAMGEYLHLLEVRAKIEDIDLEDAIQYFSDKKRDREIKVIDGSADVDCKLHPVEERKLEENEVAKPAEVLPEGVMSVRKLIETLMRCNSEHNPCVGCSLRRNECREKICKSTVYHLIKYADA